MNQAVGALYPNNLWTFFEQLNEVPRPSKHEERVRQFMLDFAKKNNLEALVDPAGNVIIKKQGSAGNENKDAVAMQSHLDMVHQKNSDTNFDFFTQGIESYIDGEWVTAKGTTLGADNGIGVATIMAVLADKNLVHPPIEALFTIDEETGMGGAFGLQAGYLTGKTLLNLDSEDEGELYIGCSGGIDTNIDFTYETEEAQTNASFLKLSVTGLKGGHSGMDIHLGRGNAIKILTRLLWKTADKFDLQLANFLGGSLRNAIPREAFATVCIPLEKLETFKSHFNKVVNEITFELQFGEPKLKIQLSEADSLTNVINNKTFNDLLNALYSSPNGALRMSDTIKNLTETSTNLALVKAENGKVEIQFLSRSLIPTAQKDICNQIEACFSGIHANINHDGEYPGWTPNPNSPVLKLFKSVYQEKFGVEPPIKAIHAGLECGILAINYPDMDMISFGPTIRDPHSPDEKVHIKSVGKYWDFLVAALAKM